MSIFGEMMISYNSVVGFEFNKVIVEQDDGSLFYSEMPERLVDIGETIDPRDLTSISNLSEEQQKYIKNKYEYKAEK